LPERLAVPGFLTAQRWIGATEPHYSLGIYDLDDLDVLRSEAYRAIVGVNASPWSRRVMGMCKRLIRCEAEQVLPGDRLAPNGAGGLLFIGLNIPAEIDADFNAWYNEEHLPALTEVSGVLCARRFRSVEGSPRYFALYHLATPDVPASAAWKEAIDTPWSARIRPHFRDRVRVVCKPWSPEK
jgi:hypothetical protein